MPKTPIPIITSEGPGAMVGVGVVTTGGGDGWAALTVIVCVQVVALLTPPLSSVKAAVAEKVPALLYVWEI